MATNLPTVLARPEIARIVNAKGAHKLLFCFRLPMYVGRDGQGYRQQVNLVDLLRKYSLRADIYTWWQKYFHESSPRKWLFDLQCEFVNRVDEHLFPIDLSEMDNMLNSGAYEEAEPLHYPILYLSYGIPWEIEAITEFDASVQPVIAVVALLLAGGEKMADEIDLWWEFLDVPRPEYHNVEWIGDLPRLRDALACQDGPLSGLSVAIECVCKDTGNVFIDSPTWLRYEYDGYDEFWWCDSDIETLAHEYAEVKDKIARLTAYQKWFDHTPGAMEQVTRLLVDLVDREYFIQDGEVIFYD